MEIVSRFWQGYFVHFFTGWPRVATYLLTAAVVANSQGSDHASAGAVLLSDVLHLGMIQVKVSDGFGIANNIQLGRVLNSMRSIIAVAHPAVRDLVRETIMSIPTYSSRAAGNANNKNYKEANIPIFYVGNTPCTGANAVAREVRMNKQIVCRVCRALKERFFQQESNEPIQSTEEEERMLNGQTIVCRIDARRARR